VSVPTGCDEVAAVNNLEQLRVLVEAWKAQATEAARVSKTGTTPRTYDKALLLLEELTDMMITTGYAIGYSEQPHINRERVLSIMALTAVASQ
jgi:hypothetical protein